MTVYTTVFGGDNISPSEVSYAAINLTSDQSFDWPLETAPSNNLIAKIMDVTAASGPFAVILPSATQVSDGETILFNNVGSNTFVVKDNDGNQVLSAASGTVWQLYLTDNTTDAGSWNAYQFGASASSYNAASLAGTGLVAQGPLLSLAAPVTEFNSDFTAGANDRAKTYVWTGANGTVTLPDAVAVGNNWTMNIRNSGTGELDVTPPGIQTINGEGFWALQPGDSVTVVTDGLTYYTLGFGQSAVFAFDYTSINVAGNGQYALSGTELNRVAYDFIGTLTGNREIIVPTTIQQYWISNSTTGAYTLTVKTASGSGVIINQGARTIMYCNGTNVVAADTGGVAVPISISDGGTGATTAGGALINLGGTSVGIAVFTAATASDAQVALDMDPIKGGTY
jgi:hypothetical protein